MYVNQLKLRYEVGTYWLLVIFRPDHHFIYVLKKSTLSSHKCPKVAAHDEICTDIGTVPKYFTCHVHSLRFMGSLYHFNTCEETKNAILCIKTGLSRVSLTHMHANIWINADKRTVSTHDGVLVIEMISNKKVEWNEGLCRRCWSWLNTNKINDGQFFTYI